MHVSGPKNEELQGILLKGKIRKIRVIHGENTNFICRLRCARSISQSSQSNFHERKGSTMSGVRPEEPVK